MRVLVAGGTGFIGPALIRSFLARGDSVVALVRNITSATKALPPEVHFVQWDGRTVGVWGRLMGNIDAVVNLSGASIGAGRWTRARKELIRESRIAPTRALIDAIRLSEVRPRVLVNASAVGYYGLTGEEAATEHSAAGTDFLGTVCQDWEKEADKGASLGVRVVLPRLGVVLAEGGGVLERMILPFRLFVGGRMGSGEQWYAWVHREDVVAAICFLLEHPTIEGPVNVVAPGGIRMQQFADELGRVLGRPSWFPVPSFALKLVLGEMSGLILHGRQIVPERLGKEGFRFKYSTLTSALRSILV
jgi:uncharacterized protein